MSTGYARINFDDVKDQAPDFGMAAMGESRYLRDQVGAEGIGASFYRMNPGRRLGFGHNHDAVEELYVVLEGDGRIKIDDDILDLRPLDAVRVAAEPVREIEAGDDGLTVIAFGTHVKGDGNMVTDFWPAETA